MSQSSTEASDYNIGIQLYTLRDRTANDFAGTLQEVAKLGYKGVEFAGFGGLAATDMRTLLDSLGLRGISAHIALAELENVDDIANYGQTIGLEYVVCPWLDPSLREPISRYTELAEKLDRLGEAYAHRGLTLCYHNHDFEFTLTNEQGNTAHDILFSSTSPQHLQVELDVYWVEKTKLSAVATIQKYKDRCPLIHLKDMSSDDKRTFAELGSGQLPIRTFIETGKACGAKWFFVEQDVCPGDPLDSARGSMEHLRTLGIVK